jgi:hypothetical protein
MPLIIRFWPRIIGGLPLTPAIVAAMHSAFLARIVRLVNENIEGVNDPADAVSVGVRSALAGAIAEGARRSGRVPKAKEEALAKAVFQALGLAEQVIKVSTSESEGGDWEGESGADWSSDDGEWEDFDGETPARKRAAAGGPSAERRRAAHALRQGARYLLRLERSLTGTGKK